MEWGFLGYGDTITAGEKEFFFLSCSSLFTKEKYSLLSRKPTKKTPSEYILDIPLLIGRLYIPVRIVSALEIFLSVPFRFLSTLEIFLSVL